MRAVVLRGGRLEVRETADPIPGPGELLLRTLSTAICASDVHFMDHHDLVPEGGPAGMVYDEDRDIVLGHAPMSARGLLRITASPRIGQRAITTMSALELPQSRQGHQWRAGSVPTDRMSR